VTSIILAGGRSLRLGRNKAFEVIGDQHLIQRVILRLAKVSEQIIVAFAEERPLPALPPHLEVKVVTDIHPGAGALGGLYTGLRHSSSFHSLVVACDMPFLNIPLLRYLMSLAPGFDAVVPWLGGLPEPLHAVYSKNCLSPIEEVLRQGKLKVIDFFPQIKVRYVDEAEIEQFDPKHLSFFNINTEADLEKARALAQDSAG
jgi:molybdopterin-guanine dinucleotide biosynthesis protein A